MVDSNLELYTDEELKQEIERRENEKKKADRPYRIPIFNFEPLAKLCENYINELDSKGWVNDDLQHYIFESAMTTFFGNDVWTWINKVSQ